MVLTVWNWYIHWVSQPSQELVGASLHNHNVLKSQSFEGNISQHLTVNHTPSSLWDISEAYEVVSVLESVVWIKPRAKYHITAHDNTGATKQSYESVGLHLGVLVHVLLCGDSWQLAVECICLLALHVQTKRRNNFNSYWSCWIFCSPGVSKTQFPLTVHFARGTDSMKHIKEQNYSFELI